MSLTFILAIALIISAATTLGVSVLQAWNIYRNPNLKPHPVINLEEAPSHDTYGFRWVQMKRASGIIPPMRTPEGTIWSGFSLGVSRENGKISSISINIYGAEQGVGHYTWFERTSTYDMKTGAGGHFSLDHVIGETESDRAERVLEYAVSNASRNINQYHRPLQFKIDNEVISGIYDPESGRNVYRNPDESSTGEFFIFGPPPMADAAVPYVRQPGAYIKELPPLEEGVKQIRLKAWNVYEQPLDNVLITVDSDTGYRYEQILNSEQTNTEGVTIVLPTLLSEIRVAITRGGFHPVTKNIILKEGIQQIDVFMEPRCVLLGDTILCP